MTDFELSARDGRGGYTNADAAEDHPAEIVACVPLAMHVLSSDGTRLFANRAWNKL